MNAPVYVYQLVARGPERATGSVREIRTTTVFTTEEAARKRLHTLRLMTTNPNAFLCLDEEGLTLDVIRLEIVE